MHDCVIAQGTISRLYGCIMRKECTLAIVMMVSAVAEAGAKARRHTSHIPLQVQDLAQASPATVSRCGMVYVDPGQLKWMPYVKTWLDTLSDKLRRETRLGSDIFNRRSCCIL